jgi:type IV secretory pathway component VirB8
MDTSQKEHFLQSVERGRYKGERNRMRNQKRNTKKKKKKKKKRETNVIISKKCTNNICTVRFILRFLSELICFNFQVFLTYSYETS